MVNIGIRGQSANINRDSTAMTRQEWQSLCIASIALVEASCMAAQDINPTGRHKQCLSWRWESRWVGRNRRQGCEMACAASVLMVCTIVEDHFFRFKGTLKHTRSVIHQDVTCKNKIKRNACTHVSSHATVLWAPKVDGTQCCNLTLTSTHMPRLNSIP